jgi:hypothetical protein
VGHDYSAEKDISYVVRFYYPQEEGEFDVDLDEVSLPTQMQYTTDKPEKKYKKMIRSTIIHILMKVVMQI